MPAAKRKPRAKRARKTPGLTPPAAWLEAQLANAQAMTTRKNISKAMIEKHTKKAELLAMFLLPYEKAKLRSVEVKQTFKVELDVTIGGPE